MYVVLFHCWSRQQQLSLRYRPLSLKAKKPKNTSKNKFMFTKNNRTKDNLTRAPYFHYKLTTVNKMSLSQFKNLPKLKLMAAPFKPALNQVEVAQQHSRNCECDKKKCMMFKRSKQAIYLKEELIMFQFRESQNRDISKISMSSFHFI